MRLSCLFLSARLVMLSAPSRKAIRGLYLLRVRPLVASDHRSSAEIRQNETIYFLSFLRFCRFSRRPLHQMSREHH